MSAAMPPAQIATPLPGQSRGTRLRRARPGACESRSPISNFSYADPHNRETVLLSAVRVFGGAPRRIWRIPARRWLEAQARSRGMYFRPHWQTWQSRLLLRIILSLSPVLLSHSARQIQCRFQHSRIAVTRDGYPRGSKSDSRQPVQLVQSGSLQSEISAAVAGGTGHNSFKRMIYASA